MPNNTLSVAGFLISASTAIMMVVLLGVFLREGASSVTLWALIVPAIVIVAADQLLNKKLDKIQLKVLTRKELGLALATGVAVVLGSIGLATIFPESIVLLVQVLYGLLALILLLVAALFAGLHT